MAKKKGTRRSSSAGSTSNKPKSGGRTRAKQPKKRKARPRRYRNRDHAKEAGQGPRDDRCLNPNAPIKVNLVRPPWKKGCLVFRPFPSLNPENPDELDPIRFSTSEIDYSDWIVRVPAVKYTGLDEQLTFHLFDPTIEGYDRRENPYIACVKALEVAVKNTKTSTGKKINTDWIKLVYGRDRKMKPPTYLYYLQGLVYQRESNVYLPPKSKPLGHPARKKDEPVSVLQLTSSAGKEVRNQMALVNEQWEGDEDDWANAYLHGDILDPAAGKFLVFYNPDVYDPDSGDIEQVDEADMEEGDIDAETTGGKEGDDDFEAKGFAMTVQEHMIYKRKKYPARLSKDAKAAKQMVLDRFQWWFTEGEDQGLLYLPTDEEIVMMMARAFRSMPDALEYGLDAHQELLLSDDVQAILKSRTAATMPGDDDEDDEEPRRRRRDPTIEDADIDDDGDELEDAEYEEEGDEGEEDEDEYLDEDEEGEAEEEEEGDADDDEEYEGEDEEEEEGDADADDDDSEYEEDEEPDYDEEESDGEEEEEEGDADDEDDEDGEADVDEDEDDDYDEYLDDEEEGDGDDGEEEDEEGDEVEEPSDREKDLERQLAEAEARGEKRGSKKKTPPAPPANKKKSTKKKKAAPKPQTKKKSANGGGKKKANTKKKSAGTSTKKKSTTKKSTTKKKKKKKS